MKLNQQEDPKMSRTIRPNSTYSSIFRRFKNMNYRRSELNAVDAMKEGGINPKNRLKSWMSRIPDTWSDCPVSAASEFLIKNKWRKWRNSGVRSHFTLNSPIK